MFAKSVITTCLVLALSLSANAHTGLSPALGVKGTIVRNQVQRPKANSPCGSVNIASAIDSSTVVKAAADGSFTASIHNFNAGADGSTFVTAKVDATGKGTKFVNAVVSKNGVAAPTSVSTSSIVAKLPAGTKCTGGKAGNLCVASFVTKAGFGNCVVVQQAAAGAKAVPAAAPAVAASSSTKAVASSDSKSSGCSAKSKARDSSKRTPTEETRAEKLVKSRQAKLVRAPVPAPVGEVADVEEAQVETQDKRTDARAVGSRAARALLREI